MVVASPPHDLGSITKSAYYLCTIYVDHINVRYVLLPLYGKYPSKS